jgi:4-diphosphocytidyl-2-C-methyl-D-erythritol kinase
MLTIKAPAKLNLTLEVMGKRPDGFHELRSVFQAIDLYDTLHIKAGRAVTYECDLPGWEASKSLVSRVLDILLGEKRGGVDINIEKRIPLLSGLGGDSSDAAALLKGLNDFWQLGLSDDKLHELAAQLGSDVPFFLKGGTALAEGRGELLTPLPSPPQAWIVVLVPNGAVEPGKTAKMYTALTPSSYTDGKITQQLIEKLKKGEPIASVWLYNAFEDIAGEIYPKLMYYVAGFIKSGVPAHLTGSGPALFSVFNNKNEAEEFYKICQSHRATAFLAATL